MRLEAGVIAIFPMYQKGKPTEIRILEIYASRAAYESHIKSPHFQKYKTTTLKMVKSLKLVDMEALDPETMTTIFQKMPKRYAVTDATGCGRTTLQSSPGCKAPGL